MTVQHETVNKIVDRILADGRIVEMGPHVMKGVRVEPHTMGGFGRIEAAFADANKLGIGKDVIAELRRRGELAKAGGAIRQASSSSSAMADAAE
jgi:hypothetical protein